MPDLTARANEIRSLHWKRQKQMADALGLVKPDSVSWDELAETIAEAEATNPDAAAIESQLPAENSEDDPAVMPGAVTELGEDVLIAPLALSFALRGNVCPACNEKLRSDNNGVFCPVFNADCPRNRKVS
ncbi:MAG: hypothetical protein KME42_14205 [Tildeniella nuda ZEHNDER 1965/U140]|jgi:hypothetical protein|nr:hypothetical protein [Tildeniella nuda ZEHNDER 1965/U140]